MDKQKKELEAIQEAKVETVTDANNLQAIKVTFDNGILFATNKSELSPAARTALISGSRVRIPEGVQIRRCNKNKMLHS